MIILGISTLEPSPFVERLRNGEKLQWDRPPKVAPAKPGVTRCWTSPSNDACIEPGDCVLLLGAVRFDSRNGAGRRRSNRRNLSIDRLFPPGMSPLQMTATPSALERSCGIETRLIQGTGSPMFNTHRACYQIPMDATIIGTPDRPRPSFSGGPNIAMKVPPAEYEATLAFYRDVIGLPLIDSHRPSNVFQFGSSLLWLDCVADILRTEIWLELITPDTAAAAEHLSRAGVPRCDSVETLPAGFDGFWIRCPASVVHLITT